MIKAWIQAFRPRTLPLALSSIGMGTFLVASKGLFHLEVFLMCVLTTIFLQILSNLANDYGDAIHGADSEKRTGPKRLVQSGVISFLQMKRAMFLFGGLSFLSGIYLIKISPGISQNYMLLVFLLLGCLAIAAAIKYTAGNNPYGYSGFGDIAVLVFFGLVGVLGTTYLSLGYLEWSFILPTLSCGCFAVAVLNVNNIRDIDSDKEVGKKSIPVRIGRNKARAYHWALLIVGISCSLAYVTINYTKFTDLAFLITVPLFLKNGLGISRFESAKDLDPLLTQMALSTLFFVVVFGLGILL